MNLFSKSKNPIVAIINLSESGVQGGVISLEDGNKTDSFLYRTAKQTTADGAIDSFSELNRSVGAVLDELVEQESLFFPQKGFFGKTGLTNFVYIVDLPFQYNYLSSSSFKSDEPVRINRSFIEQMLSEKTPDTDGAPSLIREKKDDLEFIKKDISEVILNGYPSVDFEEVEARSIDISVFNSVSPRELLDSLRSKVKQKNASSSIYFFSRVEADIVFLNHFQKRRLYEYVNINMSETPVVLVDKNTIKKITYVKQGYSDLIDRVAKEFDVPDFVADSYTSMYFSGECERSFSKKMEELIVFGMQLWELEYEKKMSVLPEAVYLNSNSHTEESFKQTLIKKHPETKVTTLREVYAESTGYSADDRVLEMAISSFFVNRIYELKEK